MEVLERDFHDGTSSFDEILDFEEVEYLDEPFITDTEEKEDYYRSLDEY